MRSAALFVAGLLVGGMMPSGAGETRRLPGVSLNHVLIRVENLDAAKRFFIDKYGFSEAFSVQREGGSPPFTYLQISRNTFLELQPATPDSPPGLGHIGLQVENIDDAVRLLRDRGVNPRDPSESKRTRARISVSQGTPGVTFELLEFPPESLGRKAMNSWK
jgi:catechol 2,3-dioxygenase-like lactoylglutathione lyase family enzyme